MRVIREASADSFGTAFIAPMNIIKMTDLDLAGKRVFIRADLNVPQDDDGRITDDTRIRASVPAILGPIPSSW